MRKALLWALLLAMLLGLTGCAAMDELSRSDALPDLRLLEQPAYEEPQPEAQAPAAVRSLRLDLWLDASQVMGGINPNEQSMYPHSSRKYREGGFHYRYPDQTSMYETMLRCLLSGMENSRVRLLRCGNERLPDDYLLANVKAGLSADELRSVRRDMLTYAIDPLPGILESFSGEKMTDSFYSLASPQMAQLDQVNSSLLENPSLVKAMTDTLERQQHAIAKGYNDSLLAVGNDSDYPLLYALDNLDLSRLSVITCDPASIRKLNTADRAGDMHALAAELLEERGVFDTGLTAGLYAFTLDYMGQLSSFGSADFSEPLLWGRLDYNNYTGLTDGILVMPRTLLMLVIGEEAQVKIFRNVFEAELARNDALKVPRGPQNGQLTYTANGQTVTQEPFAFDYDYTQISRPGLEVITQQTSGTAVTAASAPVRKDGSLSTVTLSPVDGARPNRTITLTLPVPDTADGLSVQTQNLTALQLSVQSALLQSDVLPNAPDAVIPEGAQAITLRDSIYVFTSQQVPTSPLSVQRVYTEDGLLKVDLAADGSLLRPGYYRMLFSADLPGESFAWNTPAWVEQRSVTLDNGQISAWETFAEVLTRYERKREYISKPFQHAWGDASNTSYRNEPVPDFPPVMLAPGLSGLVSQLQAAAHPDTMPLVRFVFDLFVPNQP